MADRIDLKKVRYVAFEGGGGKGLVYLGAIRALEKKLAQLRAGGLRVPSTPSNPTGSEGPPITLQGRGPQSPEPIIDLNDPMDRRWVKGVSGTSAGAITALMVAVGMNSDEISQEINEWISPMLQIGFGTAQEKKFIAANSFEHFLEDPNSAAYFRTEGGKTREKEYRNLITLLFKPIEKVAVETASILDRVLDQVYKTQSESVLAQRVLATDVSVTSRPKLREYLHSLLFNRGLFPGIAMREYFGDLIKRKLLSITPPELRTQMDSKFGDEVTFREFFNLTGVDLVVAGTNVSRRTSKFFSVGHTPEFSVVEAVCISMSIPMIFKPALLTKTKVHREATEAYNKAYHGLWVDGGMLTNFPLHAFDAPQPMMLNPGYLGELLYHVAQPSEQPAHFCDCILGFRIGAPLSIEYDESADFHALNADIAIDFLGDLFMTMWSPAHEGQIRSPEEENATIFLSERIGENKLSSLDFAGPGIDRSRKNESKSKFKESLIELAESTTNDRLQ